MKGLIEKLENLPLANCKSRKIAVIQDPEQNLGYPGSLLTF